MKIDINLTILLNNDDDFNILKTKFDSLLTIIPSDNLDELRDFIFENNFDSQKSKYMMDTFLNQYVNEIKNDDFLIKKNEQLFKENKHYLNDESLCILNEKIKILSEKDLNWNKCMSLAKYNPKYLYGKIIEYNTINKTTISRISDFFNKFQYEENLKYFSMAANKYDGSLIDCVNHIPTDWFGNNTSDFKILIETILKSINEENDNTLYDLYDLFMSSRSINGRLFNNDFFSDIAKFSTKEFKNCIDNFNLFISAIGEDVRHEISDNKNITLSDYIQIYADETKDDDEEYYDDYVKNTIILLKTMLLDAQLPEQTQNKKNKNKI